MRIARALAAAVLSAATAGTSVAAEIDSVTPRQTKLRDSEAALDTWLNERLREGVRRANELGGGCDEHELYQQLRWAISFPFIGHLIAEELDEADGLERAHVRFDESIYRDLGVLDAISVHLKDLSSVVRIDDDWMGVDKLGHFLAQGWSYFDIAYQRERGIREALAFGERSEETYFGLYTTGVYSYADLVANFEGMRFWLRVLGTAPDPLESGYFFNRPYIRCGKRLGLFGERRWRIRRRVRLAAYLNAAWDEGVNCSRYRSAEIEQPIRQRVHELELRDGVDYRCPIAPDRCVVAAERYREHASRLLHPRCAGAEAEPRWRPW
jgi:hypothetical protein